MRAVHVLFERFLWVLILFSGEAYSFTRTTVVVGAGLWSDPSSWDCFCIPASTDDAVIANGSVIVLTAASTIINDLNVEAGAQLLASGRMFHINGDLILNGNFDGASFLIWGFAGTSHTLDGTGFVSNTSTVNLFGDLDILSSADIDMIGGDLALASFSGSFPTVTNYGTISLGPANLVATHADATFDNRGILNSGNQIFSGFGKLEASTPGNTVNYYMAGMQAIKDPVSSYYNLILSTSDIKYTGFDLEVSGDLTITGSAILNPAKNDIDIEGNWINNSTAPDPFRQYKMAVTFKGSNPQSITNPNGEDFEILAISNTSGFGVTLNNQTRVDSILALSTGVVYSTLTNYLMIADEGVSTGGSSASYVDGPLRKAGDDAFTFPVGDGSFYSPIAISAPNNTSDIYQVEYHNGAYVNTSALSVSLNNVSTVEYWDLNEISGTNNLTVTLFWGNGSRSGINDLADIKISSFDGALWQNDGQGAVSGTVGSGSVTSSGAITSFGPITFGSSLAGSNPLEDGGLLPIEGIILTAKNDPGGILLTWVTASEVNNDHFALERSKDGMHFDAIARIPGNGTTADISTYSYLDKFPYSGLSYYRLKQVDFDGSYTYSDMVPVRKDLLLAAQGYKLFPNPVRNGESFYVVLPDGDTRSGEEVLIVLSDMVGREVFSKMVIYNSSGALIGIDINNSVEPGIYMVITSNTQGIIFKDRLMVVKQ